MPVPQPVTRTFPGGRYSILSDTFFGGEAPAAAADSPTESGGRPHPRVGRLSLGWLPNRDLVDSPAAKAFHVDTYSILNAVPLIARLLQKRDDLSPQRPVGQRPPSDKLPADAAPGVQQYKGRLGYAFERFCKLIVLIKYLDAHGVMVPQVPTPNI